MAKGKTLKQMALNCWISIQKNTNLNFYLTPYTNIHLKWATGLMQNGRTTQLLEEDRVFSEALTQQAWSAQILHIPKLFGPLRDNWEITQTLNVLPDVFVDQWP